MESNKSTKTIRNFLESLSRESKIFFRGITIEKVA
jgi:hypothetical protein